MCAIWTMHDLHAYGTVASFATKGYQGCPCCALVTISRRLVACHKIVYCSQHRRWFPNDCVYCKDIRAFGGVEEGTPPPKMSVDEIIATTSTREAWLEVVQRMHGDLATISSIKRLNILFKLEYWKVRHIH